MDLANKELPSADEHDLQVDESTPVRILRSDDIFQGGREVRIEHDESVYRLRLTRKGKLILHK